MMDKDFRAELDRRLELYDDPGNDEGILDPLPVRDIVISVITLAVISIVLLGWCFL